MLQPGVALALHRLGPRLVACSALPALIALLAPRSAHAQVAPMPDFGRAGDVVIDDIVGGRFGRPGYLGQLGGHGAIANEPGLDDRLGRAPPGGGFAGIAGYEHHSLDGGYSRPAQVTQEIYWFAPAVDVFVARRLSIGAAAGVLVEHATFDGAGYSPNFRVNAVRLSLVPRIGYVFPIVPRVALWPRIGAGYARGQATWPEPYDTGAAAVDELWLVGVDLGIVGRVTPWLFIHVTPTLEATYNWSVNATGESEDFAIGTGGAATVALSL